MVLCVEARDIESLKEAGCQVIDLEQMSRVDMSELRVTL